MKIKTLLGYSSNFWSVSTSCLLAILAVGFWPTTSWAKSLTWSGGGANSYWNNSVNWGGGGTPADGDYLTFPAGAARLVNTNDLTNLKLINIQFATGGTNYILRGNAISLTNGITAVYTTGASTVSVAAVTLGAAQSFDCNASGATLNINSIITNSTFMLTNNAVGSITISSNIYGSTGGLVKKGAGTLTLAGPASNTYGGTTYVNAGTLNLNVNGTAAFGGPLVIGDGSGTGSPTVRNLQSSEILDSAAITINYGGLLDLNNFNETIGTSLTLGSATITTGSGILTLQPNAVVTVNDVSFVTSISGNLNVGSSSTCTIQGSGSMNIYAVVSGAANIVKNDSVNIFLANANTFTGSLTANGSGDVDIANNTALGATNGGTTINGSVRLVIEGNINVTNENLTMNSTYASGAIWYATASGAASWRSTNITLSADTTILIATNALLDLATPLTGAGGITKSGPGTLRYSGAGNTYTGDTFVDDGLLELGKSSGVALANATSLTVGDGSGAAASAIVREIAATQLGVVPITVNSDGLFDLNNYNDTVGNSLTLNGGGDVQTGTGAMTLMANPTISLNGSSSITGNLNVGTGTCTIQGSGLLYLYANVSGTANIVKNDTLSLYLSGANTFTGTLTANNSGYLYLRSDTALGATNGGTILNGTTHLNLFPDLNITNESLTLNSSYSPTIYIYGYTNTWSSTNFTLLADAIIQVATNGVLNINAPITGTGGINKYGPGTLTFSGAGDNSYSGTTTVNEGILEFAKTVSGSALTGPLVIGDGVGNDVVRCLNNNQIYSTGLQVRVNSSGVFDLGNYTDYIGPLTLEGGQVTTTTAGLVWLYGSVTVVSNTDSQASINGRAGLYSSTVTITNTGHYWSPDLRINASVSSSPGVGLIKTGAGEVMLTASNSFTGLVTINNGSLEVADSYALGNTTTNCTVNSGGTLFLYGAVAIGAKPLVLNGTGFYSGVSSGALVADYGNSSWAGPVTLASDSMINVSDGAYGLTLSGAIGGTAGLTKIGPGSLTLSGNGNNGYSGTTLFTDGLIQLNKTGGAYAIGNGTLTIGDSTGAANSTIVRELGNNQIYQVAVIIESDGRLDLNAHSDILADLTLNGGADVVNTVAGTLTLTANRTVTVNGSGASISGNLNVGTGTCTIEGTGSLTISANTSGSAAIVKNGSMSLYLYGANTFTNSFTANGSSAIYINNPLSLGGTNGGTTLNDQTWLGIGGNISITNEALVLNSSFTGGGVLFVSDTSTNVWYGTFLLSNDTPVNIGANKALELSGPISGVGGITTVGTGRLIFSGSTQNFYTGDTTVNVGTLELNKSSGYAIYAGTLTVGDGMGGLHADVVRYTAGGSQLYVSVSSVVNSSGLLDLNGHTDDVGPVTLNGGDITTGTGKIEVAGNLRVMGSSQTAHISGNLQFWGVTRTITVETGSAFYALDISASVSDQGNGFVVTNSTPNTQFLRLLSSNSFTGPLAIGNVKVDAENDWALGQTNGATSVSSNGVLWLYGVDIPINESLTLGGGTWLAAQNPCSWAGPITLNGDATISSAGGGLFEIIGRITGTGNLLMYAGDQPIRLSGSQANDYVGNTTMLLGTLELNKSSGPAIPYPYWLFIGGTTNSAEVRELANYQTDHVQVDRSGLLNLNGFIDAIGDLNLYNGGNVQTGSGQLQLGSGYKVTVDGPEVVATSTISGNCTLLSGQHTVNVTNGARLDISATVSGSGALTKIGPNDMHLLSSNSYSGLTVVQNGFLWAHNASALGATNGGTVVSNGASLVLYGNFGVTNEALTLNGLGVNASWGALDSETAGANIWTGPITINADSTIAPYGSSTQLRLLGPISGSGGVAELAGSSGTIYFEGSSGNTYAGTTTVGSGTLVLAKTSGLAVPGNLSMYGTVRLGNNQQISDNADVLVNGGGLFEFGAYQEWIDTLRGSGTVNFGTNGWIYLGLNNGSSTFDGQFTGVGFASGWTVGKDGTGTFTMTGTNTFSAGETHVLHGTLVINGSQPQSPVIVDSVATLGGTGTVGTILGNGTISPGASPGTLTSSNVAFSASATFAVELTGSGTDQLNVRGTNNLGGATLSLTTSAFAPVEGQPITILNNDGAESITGTFAGLPEGSLVSVGAIQYLISYAGGSGNDVTLTFTNDGIRLASTAISAGNGNGVVDANECDYLNVVVTNASAYALSGVSATLTPVTPGVAVTFPVSAYADVPASSRGTNAETFQFATWPGFAASCGSNVQLNLTVQSTSHGTFTLPVTLPSGSPGVSVPYGWSGSRAIPDGLSVTQSIAVAGFVGPLAKVTVSLYAGHFNDADLDIYLIGPDGTTVELSTDNGGSGDDFGVSCTQRTTFDDSAATSITAGAAPFSGTYRPEGSLSVFRGKSDAQINGEWKLVLVDDNANGFGGQLSCWTVNLYHATCTDGGGVCESCPERTIAGAITASGQIQDGRMNRNASRSDCASNKTCPGIFVSGTPRYFDAYTFLNGESNACVTVAITSAANLFSTAYLNSYNPSNLCENYLADPGSSAIGGSTNYSFTIPAFGAFVVVINQVNVGDFGDYTLTVTGGSCRPLLNVAAAGANRVAVGWSTAAIGYQLMQTNTLGNTPAQPWTPVAASPVVTGSKFSVTNNTGALGPQRFYELRKP